MTPTRVQLAKLAQRIPDQFVEQVDVGKGRREAYIPHEVVEQFLLYILGPFDFEVLQLIRGDLPATPPNPQGQSDRAKAGTPALTGVVVGALCRLTAEVDGRRTIVVEAGDVEDPHNWNNDGKRAKAAASDALKRCAMRLGFGLELRAGEQYVLDKWLPVPTKDETAATSGAGRGGPAPDTTQTTQRTSRARSTGTKQESAPAQAASPVPPAEDAPAATPPPEAAAGATNGHPADQATNMDELAAALGRALNNCWLRLKRAGQNGDLPEQFANLNDAKALKALSGDDFELARAWLIDHSRKAGRSSARTRLWPCPSRRGTRASCRPRSASTPTSSCDTAPSATPAGHAPSTTRSWLRGGSRERARAAGGGWGPRGRRRGRLRLNHPHRKGGRRWSERGRAGRLRR